jgi:hypothetical protein
VLGSLIDQLFFESNGCDGKACGADSGAGEGKHAHFVFVSSAYVGSEHDLCGRFRDADAKNRSGGVFRCSNVAKFELLAEGIFGVVRSVGAEVRVLQELQAVGTVKIGDGSDTSGEGAKSIGGRYGLRGSGLRGSGKYEQQRHSDSRSEETEPK